MIYGGKYLVLSCVTIASLMLHVIDLQYKIWVKTSAEQQFLYGNHVLKSGIGRMTENVEKYQGVVIYSMNDLPLVISLASFALSLLVNGKTWFFN
jgi:60S ribosome subunit biogenesis protein NIP7